MSPFRVTARYSVFFLSITNSKISKQTLNNVMCDMVKKNKSCVGNIQFGFFNIRDASHLGPNFLKYLKISWKKCSFLFFWIGQNISIFLKTCIPASPPPFPQYNLHVHLSIHFKPNPTAIQHLVAEIMSKSLKFLNNVKHSSPSLLSACIAKSILVWSDSFLLIMSSA